MGRGQRQGGVAVPAPAPPPSSAGTHPAALATAACQRQLLLGTRRPRRHSAHVGTHCPWHAQGRRGGGWRCARPSLLSPLTSRLPAGQEARETAGRRAERPLD